MLPMLGANLAVQGAQGLVAISLIPLAKMQESTEERCKLMTDKGITIGESLEVIPPSNEGKVATFEPAQWHLEWARDGYPQIESTRRPVDGTLSITDRSVFFAPAAGAVSIRIPYELVQEVDFARVTATGEVRSLVVKSCFGRFDIVTLTGPRSSAVDKAATDAAAAEIKARVAAFEKV